ncbi:hypothetical protein SDC9_111667 [bioreactor metagenome]|uniref:Uncharacterized protein n=1 Tax=bioreactor metagenome TaxID=1076179 RepID=A0A645BI62_9ZZZZ
MIHAQDAHVCPAPRAALLDRFGCDVEHAHKADRPARYSARGADGCAFLPQAGEREARAAAGFVDQCRVFHRLEDLLHAIANGQHKARGKLPQRAACVHQRRRIR